MESGPYQLQIFISLVVILAAAFVALICDFLKGNNEQLRELVIELKVRRDSDYLRSPSPAADQKPIEILRTPPHEQSASAAPPIVIQEEPAPPPPPLPKALPPAAPPVTVMAPAPEEEKVPQPVAAAPAVGKKDWKLLLARSPKRKEVAGQRNSNSFDSNFPAGYHDQYVLSRLIRSNQPITGLVVSIGVSTSRKPDGSMPDSVVELMRSLIGSGDFACQSGLDEFLLIYPGERAAAAQRRLNQIAQDLWDFHLSSLAMSSLPFSWGGLEVNNEPIEEAIASASERMQETRRGRKRLTVDSRQLRAAV